MGKSDSIVIEKAAGDDRHATGRVGRATHRTGVRRGLRLLGSLVLCLGCGPTDDPTVPMFSALTVTTTALPDGVENSDYGTRSLAAVGGDGTYTWALTAGSGPLPTGLSLTASGHLTGTPTAPGTFGFTVEVTSGDGQTAEQALSIRVFGVLSVTTSSLPDGTADADYGTQSLAAVGGDGTYTWALTGGSGPLPTGLSLSADGNITGTPTTPGTFGFTVEVTSGDGQTSEQALSIRVFGALTVTTTSLPDGVENADYGTQALAAVGGDGTYTWALTGSSGPLPTGLSLAADGSITGTPTTQGSFSFTVEVTSGDGQTAQAGLTIMVLALAQPTITTVSPNTGPTTGGTAITMTGTGFQTNATVTVGGALATNVSVASATSITATTPAGSVGAADVVVTNPDQGTVTASGAFTYTAPPTITTVSPSTGPATGGTAITITGTGFQTNATVTVGGTLAANVSVASATSITATTPAGSVGAADVVVTNPDQGTVTASGAFTYTAVPTITTVSPSTGPTTGGTAITITGTGFQTNATVTVGGSLATNVSVASATSITATTPAGPVGAADVVVTNPDQGTVTASGGFTYTALPTITTVAPSTGPTAGGTAITITGTGFQTNATVTVGGTLATNVSVASATSITATTPAGPVGAADVVVTNPDQGTVTASGAFTYNTIPPGSRAYVVNAGTDDLSVIDIATNTVVATVPVGTSPTDIAITGDGSLAYVANAASNDVSVVDLSTNTVVETFAVGAGPIHIAVTPDGTSAYVTHTAQFGMVSAIDLSSNTVVNTIPLGWPQGVATSPDGAFAYVAKSDSIAVISTATHTMTDAIRINQYQLDPDDVAITPDGAFAYSMDGQQNNAVVIDLSTNTISQPILVGTTRTSIAFTPDGALGYVTVPRGVGIIADWLEVIDLSTNEVTSTTIPIGIGARPIALAITPESITPANYLAYVANFDIDTVSVVDVSTNTVIATIPVGDAPRSVAIRP